MTDSHIKSLAIYHEYRETTLKSTGEWLLREPRLQEWMARESPLAFITGGPGTGKSYLSCITISKTKACYPEDDFVSHLVSVAHFYVKEHDQDLQDLRNILKSLAWQIARVDPAFQCHAVASCEHPKRQSPLG